MRYISTGPAAHEASLSEAVSRGLAPDGGVYVPQTLGRLPETFLSSLRSLSRESICSTVANYFLEGEVPPEVVEQIIADTMTFDAPVRRLDEKLSALELFHGPTLAFKDFGARFMAALIAWFRRNETTEITVLVATSGDTGGAVGHGFLGRDGIRVVILYPSGRVSELQEKQLTTMGGNVFSLEVDGTFDDCQRLVKSAFNDAELQRQRPLTSANSINIARLIPQSFYYFLAFQQLPPSPDRVVVSVPSGNFGNLTAGILAKRLGLPIHRFIAATNANDVVPHYLATGHYTPRDAIPTLSNAMDVGAPNNFARLRWLYGGNRSEMLHEITGASFTDEETREAMREVYRSFHYILDPHGAVAYLGSSHPPAHAGTYSLFLHPAHPAKFRSVVEDTLGITLDLPPALAEALHREKRAQRVSAAYDDLRDYLLSSDRET